MNRRLRIIPLLLRPKALAVKNYWQRRKGEKGLIIRDTVVIVFGFCVMIGIYRGGLWMMDQLQTEKAMVYFPPSVPLGLIFVYLFLMLILSNSAAAVASLYLAHDLDLILSSPLRPARFFWGKFLDILFSSSWITMIFILPAIYSFARYYHAPFSYYLMSLAILAPYFVIPTALAMIGITLYSRVVSAARTREVLIVLAAVGLAGMYVMFRVIFPEAETFTFKKLEDILRLVSILSIPNTHWSPSYWASTCLSELLIRSKESYLPHLVLLYSVAIALLSAAFLVVRGFHFDAYSRALSNQRRLSFDSKKSQRRMRILFALFPASVRAQVTKEMKLFSRDLSQLFQLVLLSGICLLYFYNFRIIHGIQAELPEQTRKWWSIFVFVVNTYIEAFLVTAVGTRFVFQTISLEGRSFWIIQSAPVSMRAFLRTKLICWFVPVALILGVIFASGAYAVGAPLYVVLLKMISSWIICFGIVGLGVGLGAYYSNFSWEHATQLAASFGSLVYMLACVGLVSLDMGILGIILIFNNLYESSALFSFREYMLGCAAAGALFLYLNFTVTRWALRFGEAELERRMS